jgi:hypothetical protein
VRNNSCSAAVGKNGEGRRSRHRNEVKAEVQWHLTRHEGFEEAVKAKTHDTKNVAIPDRLLASIRSRLSEDVAPSTEYQQNLVYTALTRLPAPAVVPLRSKAMSLSDTSEKVIFRQEGCYGEGSLMGVWAIQRIISVQAPKILPPANDIQVIMHSYLRGE